MPQLGMKQRFKDLYTRVSRFFVDAVVPQFCAVCKQHGAIVCRECLGLLPNSVTAMCPACEKIGELKCASCEHTLDGVFYVTWYSNPTARALIHSAKYHFIKKSAVQAGILLARAFGNSQIRPVIDVIIPIPLHPHRFAERGFNQATELARATAQLLNIPLQENILNRLKSTAQQATLVGASRTQNVQNAFIANSSPTHVLLVDDVYTTGATCIAAATALKQAGATKVYVLVFAKG